MNARGPFSWQWPAIGATPVSQGLDSEIFDTKEVPHIQTFVREAIQNSLDARRRDNTAPVRVKFTFGEGPLADRARLLSDLAPQKARCGLPWPDAWAQNRMSWLTVEDSNTTGLEGDVTRRKSDFWNYWLNFGVSNKGGSGRGGRGIGRVTFLIASEISAVIGLTRRSSDKAMLACGMSVMRLMEDGDDYRCSYAYLAEKERGNIYTLHSTPEFYAAISDGFGVNPYTSPDASGFSLIIPYPRTEITPDGILAAAIEHFGPAILDGTLIVEVNSTVLEQVTIDAAAMRLKDHFSAPALQQDPRRVLDLMRDATGPADFRIDVTNASGGLMGALEDEVRATIRQQFEQKSQVAIDLGVPLKRTGMSSVSRVRTVMRRTPFEKRAADFFFRGGMSLPKVTARRPADIDLIVQAADGELVTYLNCCEGKAHLDLTEHQEVRDKLKESGFEVTFAEKRLVRHLMDDLRAIVLPDPDKPDASIFARYFAVPKQPSPVGPKKTPKKPTTTVVVVDPPDPRIPALIVDTLDAGFRVRANPAFIGWPLAVRIEVAYADGSARPGWSRFDFRLSDLVISSSGCASPRMKDNVLSINDCGAGFIIDVTGFDANRELVTLVSSRRMAGTNAKVNADA
jgi:hypothetical protein